MVTNRLTIPSGGHPLKKILTTLLVAGTVAALLLSAYLPVQAAGGDDSAPTAPETPQYTYSVFLPALPYGSGKIVKYGHIQAPVMLGIYPDQWWAPNPQGVINNEFTSVDQWSGKRLTLAGVFHLLEDTNLQGNVTYLLGVIWDNGYTPFVNMYSKHNAYDIASGKLDGQIRAWAQAYAAYAENGKRMAFLAPLQEMNGYWVPYTGDPENFKIAFRRIQQIFKSAGVPDQSVRWVFAPNGYSDRSDYPFETYYPGNVDVDVVAFSAYNYGYHPNNRYKEWQTPEQVFAPYIERMQAMAPDKPIFIAQTGTTAYAAGGKSAAAKNAWLEDAYNYLVSTHVVQAVLYYNSNPDYDWAFYKPALSLEFSGYRTGVNQPEIDYLSPEELMKKDLTIR